MYFACCFGGFIFTYRLFRGRIPVSAASTTVAGFIHYCRCADYFCTRLVGDADSGLDRSIITIAIFVKGYQMKVLRNTLIPIPINKCVWFPSNPCFIFNLCTHNAYLITLKGIVLSFLLFCAGCGVVGSLAAERGSEQKIPAEYSLKSAGYNKILVYVRSRSSNQSTLALRGYLTEAINARIINKASVPKETTLIPYAQLQSFYSTQGGLTELSPFQIAKAMDADAVLVVEIVNYKLSAISGSSLHTGWLESRASLYDSTGQVAVWPVAGSGKTATVGFDIESGSSDQAMARLTSAAAHCIVRYFYNCPKNQFKIFEEAAGADSW